MFTVPAEDVNVPPFTEYVPPVIEIGAAELMPETVIVFEVIAEFKAAPVRSVKVNWSGVVSTVAVVLQS